MVYGCDGANLVIPNKDLSDILQILRAFEICETLMAGFKYTVPNEAK